MTTFNEEMLNTINACSDLKTAKEGFFSGPNANMIGGVIGVVVATGLELVSPTGSKTSAVLAAVAGAATLYYGKELIEGVPQSGLMAASTGVVSCYAGMCAGRIAACYFPGNLED